MHVLYWCMAKNYSNHKIVNIATGAAYRNHIGKDVWYSRSAATAHVNRNGLADTHKVVAEAEYVEPQVERTNHMTGEKFTEGVNTPLHLSPASETYWSM